MKAKAFPCSEHPQDFQQADEQGDRSRGAREDDVEIQTLHGVGGLAIEPGHKQAIQSVYQYHPSEKHQG